MNILVIAPHRDDEILGCGGTIAKYIDNGDKVFVCFVTLAKKEMFSEELINNGIEEAKKCHKLLDVEKTFNLEFPAALLDTVDKYKLNNAICNVVNEVKPDIVYIPHYGDMHTDHQIVSDATMVAIRPNNVHKVKEVYMYETLSETEWNYSEQHITFIPNVYNDISNYLDTKIEAMACYKSQLYDFPHPRSLDALKHLANYRGSQVLVNAAECFRVVRIIK